MLGSDYSLIDMQLNMTRNERKSERNIEIEIIIFFLPCFPFNVVILH